MEQHADGTREFDMRSVLGTSVLQAPRAEAAERVRTRRSRDRRGHPHHSSSATSLTMTPASEGDYEAYVVWQEEAERYEIYAASSSSTAASHQRAQRRHGGSLQWMIRM